MRRTDRGPPRVGNQYGMLHALPTQLGGSVSTPPASYDRQRRCCRRGAFRAVDAARPTRETQTFILRSLCTFRLTLLRGHACGRNQGAWLSAAVRTPPTATRSPRTDSCRSRPRSLKSEHPQRRVPRCASVSARRPRHDESSQLERIAEVASNQPSDGERRMANRVGAEDENGRREDHNCWVAFS